MKAVILYRPNSEHARVVEEYMHDFVRRNPSAKMELLSLDTIEGTDKVSLYGITQYPAILAMKDDGALMKHWEGVQFPLMNELAAYIHG